MLTDHFLEDWRILLKNTQRLTFFILQAKQQLLLSKSFYFLNWWRQKAITMKKITKEDISQEVFDLYDDYAHNKIERRQFIEK